VPVVIRREVGSFGTGNGRGGTQIVGEKETVSKKSEEETQEEKIAVTRDQGFWETGTEGQTQNKGYAPSDGETVKRFGEVDNGPEFHFANDSGSKQVGG